MLGAVPAGLRRWFVVHFVADVAVAIPLFVAPRAFLELLGWTEVDPLAARLVAAALLAIGIESLVCRSAGVETFRAMLGLKIIWSASATVGILWSQIDGGPPMGWLALGIFAAFHLLWVHYRLRLRAE